MNAPSDPHFAARIRDSFGRQKAMALIGASLTSVAPAYSLMPADCSLITVEYKINILAPATSPLTARGEVVKAGRTLTVARAEVYAHDGRHIATMQQTLMMLPGTPDHAQ